MEFARFHAVYTLRSMISISSRFGGVSGLHLLLYPIVLEPYLTHLAWILYRQTPFEGRSLTMRKDDRSVSTRPCQCVLY